MAPLPRGGTIRTSAQGGAGKMVLLAEIVHRLARRSGGRAVYVGWSERFYRPEEASRSPARMSSRGFVLPRAWQESIRVQLTVPASLAA